MEEVGGGFGDLKKRGEINFPPFEVVLNGICQYFSVEHHHSLILIGLAIHRLGS